MLTMLHATNHRSAQRNQYENKPADGVFSIKTGLQKVRKFQKTLNCFSCKSSEPDRTLQHDNVGDEIKRLFGVIRTPNSKCHHITLRILECRENRHNNSDSMLTQLLTYQMHSYKPESCSDTPHTFFYPTPEKPEKNKYTCQLMKIVWARHTEGRYKIQSTEKLSSIKQLKKIFFTYAQNLYLALLYQTGSHEDANLLFKDTFIPEESTIHQSGIIKNLYGIRKKPKSNQYTFDLSHLEKLIKRYLNTSAGWTLLPDVMSALKDGKPLAAVLKLPEPEPELVIDYKILRKTTTVPETEDMLEDVDTETMMKPSTVKLKEIEGVVGFPRDYGNLTCFVNATLKAFFTVINDRILNEIKTMTFEQGSMEKKIQQSFLQLYELYTDKHKKSEQTGEDNAKTVKEALHQFMNYCSQYGDKSHPLRALFPSCDPTLIPQNDAQEFLSVLLSVLYNEKDKHALTLHSFNAVTRNRLKVHDRIIEKPARRQVGFFLQLHLDSDDENITIQHLVDTLFKEEELSEDEWLYLSSDNEELEQSDIAITGAGDMRLPKHRKYPTTRWQTLEAELGSSPYTSSSSDSDSRPMLTKRRALAKPSAPDSTSRQAQPHKKPFDVVCFHISPFSDPSKKVQRGQNLLARFEETVTLQVANLNDLNQTTETIKLRAKSIVCHRGDDFTGGHYTALVRSHNRWRLEDDLRTFELADSTIPEAEAVRHFNNGEFYLVFYQPYFDPESDDALRTTPVKSIHQ